MYEYRSEPTDEKQRTFNRPNQGPTAGFGGYKRLVTTKNGKTERFLQENVCPVLDSCGKCTLLNLPYNEQLARKTQLIKEKIFSLGAELGNVSVKDCVNAPEKLAYRHSVHLMISEHKSSADESRAQKRRIDIGFYQPNLRQVVDIGRCPIQTIHLNHIVAWLRTGIRIHNVSIQMSSRGSTAGSRGLLDSVILHSIQSSKQVFVCFIVTKLNSAELRPLACDIAAKFSNVRGIFMKTKDDTENQNIKVLTGHSDMQENFFGMQLQQTLKSVFHPNLAVMKKMVMRISDIKKNYCAKSEVSVLSFNKFLSTVIECVSLDRVLKEKFKMVCFVSSLSQKEEKVLKTLTENDYNVLFVEPFDVLPGTDYCENIILLSLREKS